MAKANGREKWFSLLTLLLVLHLTVIYAILVLFYVSTSDLSKKVAESEAEILASATLARGTSPPQPFDLVSPQDGATASSLTPTLGWSSSQGASSYFVQVDTESSFSEPLAYTSGKLSKNTVSHAVPAGKLAAGSTYYWTVKAVNSHGTTAASNAPFALSTAAQTANNTSSAASFSDDFSSYATDSCFAAGTVFGNWSVVFSGYGCVKVESGSGNQWLHENPQASSSPSETHASLVVGPSFTGPFTYEAKVLTAQQLRTGSPPNPWEVAWVIWHYTDNDHFYYFTPKPNGWELGKEDPAYPGNQRFLATGSSPTFQTGSRHDVKIVQESSNRITVYANGQLITAFVDTERPYASGRIALYTEDAHAHFDDIRVSQP